MDVILTLLYSLVSDLFGWLMFGWNPTDDRRPVITAQILDQGMDGDRFQVRFEILNCREIPIRLNPIVTLIFRGDGREKDVVFRVIGDDFFVKQESSRYFVCEPRDAESVPDSAWILASAHFNADPVTSRE